MSNELTLQAIKDYTDKGFNFSFYKDTVMIHHYDNWNGTNYKTSNPIMCRFDLNSLTWAEIEATLDLYLESHEGDK